MRRVYEKGLASWTLMRRATFFAFAFYAGCSSSRLESGGTDHVPAIDDGASPDDGSVDARDAACAQTDDAADCSGIIRCTPCADGLCGPVSNLRGCDQEGDSCVVQGEGLCIGTRCTCSQGAWLCTPQGQACPRVGLVCSYQVNFYGGGGSQLACRACAGDTGGPIWSEYCNPTCGEVGLPCCPNDDCGVGNTCIHDSTSPEAGLCVRTCGTEGRPCCAGGDCGTGSLVCTHESSSSMAGICRACAVLGGPCCPGTIPSRACGIHGLVCDTTVQPEGRCMMPDGGASDAATDDGGARSAAWLIE